MGLIFSHYSTASITKNQFEHDHQTTITENGPDKHNIELVVNMADVKIIDEKLTDYEKNIIRFSYMFIKEDLSQFGVIAFMKSFETIPDIQDKFDEFRHLPIDELSQSHALRTHSRKVFNIIDNFVTSIDTSSYDDFKASLVELGKRHSIYRARKEFFLVIEYQFVKAIEPIMLKNLRAIDKNDLANISNQFLVVYETKDTNGMSDHLNICEVKKCMELINLVWHRVFSIIRLYMNKGIDTMDASNKHNY